MDKKDFFNWCYDRELKRNNEIADVFCVSSQTIRNWSRKDDDMILPSWVELACLVLEDPDNRLETKLKFPVMTVSQLSAWQRAHGFKTYEDIAGVFGIRRQAVFNWHKRGSFPPWLSLGCAGFDLKTSLNKGT